MSNPLYHYLKQDFYTSRDPAFEQKLIFKEPSEGVSFALYELPLEAKESIFDGSKQYAIAEHHLSFYDAKSPGTLKRFGEYHYTATFTGPAQEGFKLHAFFNRQDQCFSYDFTDAQGKTVPIPSLLVKRFAQLAIENSRHFIGNLRLQRQQTLFSLKEQYHQEEAKLSELSRCGYRTRKYLKALEGTLTTLEKLHCLENAYRSIYRLLSRRKKMILEELQSQPSPLSQRDAGTAADKSKESSSEEEKAFTAPRLQTRKTKKPRPCLTQPIQQAALDETHYLQRLEKKSSLPADKERQVELFTALHAAVNDLAAALAEEKQKTTLTALQTVQGLVVRLPQHGEALLTTLLKEKNFKLAAKLGNLVDQLPLTVFEQALREGNGPLLDFLLTHGQFAINSQLVDGLPPVMYCYKKHSPTTPMVACLSTLIKHGASTLIKDSDGLPVAHHIIADPFHPLQKAAIENRKKMLGRSMFAVLEAMLQDYLRQRPRLPPTQTKTLQKSMATYRKNREAMKGMSVGGLATLAQKKVKAEVALQPESKNLIERLRKDAEFMEKRARFYDARMRFFSMQSARKKQNILHKSAPKTIQDIEEEVFNKAAVFSFAEAKKFALEYFNDYVLIYDGACRMAELGKMTAGKSSKHRKAAKNARQEIAHILRNVAPLLKKYDCDDILPSSMHVSTEIGKQIARSVLGDESKLQDLPIDLKDKASTAAILSRIEEKLQETDKLQTKIFKDTARLEALYDSLTAAKNLGEALDRGIEHLFPLMPTQTEPPRFRHSRKRTPAALVSTSSNLFSHAKSPLADAPAPPQTSTKPGQKRQSPSPTGGI